ncbi:MAG: N-acetylmuramoyl-L-alanine amidase [Crocinitomicaceae bacterium]|nr:N-acetylmuramoyl-L-alanine amidase [Crocinitomicaceae bacterium]
MQEKRTKLPIFNGLQKNAIRVFLLAALFLISNNFIWGQTSKIKTIVIDAGHGGHDPGCHGAQNNEKEVCLSMALKLGALIKERYPDIKIIYTRSTDVFVELAERANIANRNNADLFICIHANAGSTTAYGSETYVLGLHRTDAQQKVAERENASIALEDDKGAKYRSYDLTPDGIIALQFQLAVFHRQSILFAEMIQKEFKRIGRYDRGVKQAGFLVLYKTTMPSVLIETAFLPNPTEEKLIGTAEGQQKMAQSMFQAFVNYKNATEGKTVVGGTTTQQPSNENNQALNNTTKPVEIPKETPKEQGLVFKVQIETSNKPIPVKSSHFNNLEIFEYQDNTLYKYCAGSFPNDLQAAKNYKNELIQKGFPHAFVVAFLDGERISIEKALKLAEKN